MMDAKVLRGTGERTATDGRNISLIAKHGDTDTRPVVDRRPT